MRSQTWHIHIKGQVQGVGFRPFVYQTAQSFGLNGWVNNSLDGVHVEFNANSEKARQFYEVLIEDAPSLSAITGHNLQRSALKDFDNFEIIHSSSGGKANLLLTPDFAICHNCRSELFDEANRRSGYPFITCTHCGPRYSIIRELPYDRGTTAMEEFAMCPVCEKEYWDPIDRRYYSQTNSCTECGIAMRLYNSDAKMVAHDYQEIIKQIAGLWSQGKIVAIKGIGGYLLTCDAAE